VTIHRPIEEVYAFWRSFENLPRFMEHLELVTVYGDGRSHWITKAPLGAHVEWDAEVVEDIPNRLISWRSLPGGDVENRGRVQFERAPSDRGTIVRVDMLYHPPAGRVGAAVAKLFGEDPERQVHEDLRRFKQVMETGEPVLSEGTLHGTKLFGQRPAQPPEDAVRPPAIRGATAAQGVNASAQAR
jgi:uncharacterized membrane protein